MKIAHDVDLVTLKANVMKCFAAKYLSGMSLVPHIVGKPGIGKSAFTRSLVGTHQHMGMNFNIDSMIDFRSMLHTPDEIKGLYLPAPPGTKEFEEGKLLNHMVSHFPSKPNTLFVYEELNAADPDVQKALLELMLDEKINDKKLPPFTYFVATGNEKSDAKRMYDLIEPLQDRVITMRYSPSDNDIINTVSRFSLPLGQLLANTPTYLKDVKSASGDGWSPTPRFLEFMSPLVNAFVTGKIEAGAMNKYKMTKVAAEHCDICDDIIGDVFGNKEYVTLSVDDKTEVGAFLDLVFASQWPTFTDDLSTKTKKIIDLVNELASGKTNENTAIILPMVLMGYDANRFQEYGLSSYKEAVDLLLDVIEVNQSSMRAAIQYLNAIGETEFIKRVVSSIRVLGDKDPKYLKVVHELKQFGAGAKYAFEI
ncbi:hypothetical protein HNP86_001834 [Methanococcus maripaludis]|uniref:ATPase dynein-related AAA domain-containing protein n=1 Tax=Methanococcus maripaludis TaxID=39152 RepID=A0A7J9NWP9_METMI|nr:AAA family ATPase [Methanococcus maripaludis]MBA2851675.1 hypothetical protein [Methanococcus maripaludis]